MILYKGLIYKVGEPVVADNRLWTLIEIDDTYITLENTEAGTRLRWKISRDCIEAAGGIKRPRTVSNPNRAFKLRKMTRW